MSTDNDMTGMPPHGLLTIQEAAALFHVSRSFVVRLLDEGRIPFTRVGTQKRIRHSDLMAYQRQREVESAAALDELVAQAQEHDLGY